VVTNESLAKKPIKKKVKMVRKRALKTLAVTSPPVGKEIVVEN
jgi:hypothetical protein